MQDDESWLGKQIPTNLLACKEISLENKKVEVDKKSKECSLCRTHSEFQSCSTWEMLHQLEERVNGSDPVGQYAAAIRSLYLENQAVPLADREIPQSLLTLFPNITVLNLVASGIKSIKGSISVLLNH